MPWIFSLESEDSVLASKGTRKPSRIVKTTRTPREFYSLECETDALTERRSAPTSKRLEAEISTNGLTSSRAVFHAKIFPVQDAARAWAASEAAFSSRSSALWKKSRRRLSSSKTYPRSGREDWSRYSKLLPIFGMIRDGRLSQPASLEPRTFARDGSSLRTPTACDYGKNVGRKSDGITPSGRDRFSLSVLWSRGQIPTPTVSQKSYDVQKNGSKSLSISGLWKASTGTTLPPSFCEWIMDFPLGWTVIDASVIPWFRPKRGKLLKG